MIWGYHYFWKQPYRCLQFSQNSSIFEAQQHTRLDYHSHIVGPASNHRLKVAHTHVAAPANMTQDERIFGTMRFNKLNALILKFNNWRCQIFGYAHQDFNYMMPTCTIGFNHQPTSIRKPESHLLESPNFMRSLIPSVNESALSLNPSS